MNFKAALILSNCCLVLFSHSLLADARPSASEVQQYASELAASYQQMGWFSGAMLLKHQGQPVIHQAYGYADFDKKRKNTLQTRFNLGSIAKLYTAALVLKLVDQQKLALTDTLGDLQMRFADPRAADITVLQMLNHTAGFADIFNAEYRADMLAFDSLQKKFALLQNTPLISDPGADYRYSNYGYVVLGTLLERKFGKPYPTLLEEQLFTPLGLKQSHSFLPETHPAASLKYRFGYDGKQQYVGIIEHPGPSGGIEATVADVAAFFEALVAEKIISESGLKTMRELFAPGGLWGAFGGGTGISAAFEWDSQSDWQVTVLANSDGLVAERVSNRIIDFAMGKPAKAPMTRATTFTFQHYKSKGLSAFNNTFKAAYQAAGYTQFIGRTINELGMALLDEKQFDDANAMFASLAHHFPDAPQAYDSMAWGYLRSGQLDKIAPTFDKALALSADFKSDYSPDNYQNTGTAQ